MVQVPKAPAGSPVSLPTALALCWVVRCSLGCGSPRGQFPRKDAARDFIQDARLPGPVWIWCPEPACSPWIHVTAWLPTGIAGFSQASRMLSGSLAGWTVQMATPALPVGWPRPAASLTCLSPYSAATPMLSAAEEIPAGSVSARGVGPWCPVPGHPALGGWAAVCWGICMLHTQVS